MSNLFLLRKQLKSKSNPRKAKLLQGFFKTGKGEYAEGDVFLGLTSARIKEIADNFKDLSFKEIQELLKSKIYEERVAALRILIHQFQSVMRSHNNKDARQSGTAMMRHSALTRQSALTRKSGQNKEKGNERKKLFDFYLKNTKYINNWDLVDMSAPKIVGEYLAIKLKHLSTKTQNCKKILYKLAKSKNLWERRIAIISTLAFIVKNDFEDALKISEILLNDKHDLIHKAVGWMLREVGKRDLAQEEKFLKKHYKVMPRTMLRYAIEKFPEKKRKMYLNGQY